MSADIRLLSWNCTSATQGRLELIIDCIRVNKLDGALLQETRWHEFSPPPVICGFTVYSKPRNSYGGGVAILLRNDLVSTPRRDLETEAEAVWADIHLTSGRTLLVGSIYIPPLRHKSMGVLPLDSLRTHSLLAGDFNARHRDWDSACRSPNPAGSALARLVSIRNLVIHQTDPTHFSPIASVTPHSTIDLAISTAASATFFSAATMDSLDGHHRPLLIELSYARAPIFVSPHSHRHWRIRTADPSRLIEAAERQFASFLQSHSSAERRSDGEE